MVKNLPAMQETQVQSLGREDSLEKEMVTHFSILAWRIPRPEEPGEFHAQRSLAGYCPWGRRESDLTQQLILSLSLQERNGNVSISKRSLKERETEKTKK